LLCGTGGRWTVVVSLLLILLLVSTSAYLLQNLWLRSGLLMVDQLAFSLRGGGIRAQHILGSGSAIDKLLVFLSRLLDQT